MTTMVHHPVMIGDVIHDLGKLNDACSTSRHPLEIPAHYAQFDPV
jgi:hypothetical protein